MQLAGFSHALSGQRIRWFSHPVPVCGHETLDQKTHRTYRRPPPPRHGRILPWRPLPGQRGVCGTDGRCQPSSTRPEQSSRGVAVAESSAELAAAGAWWSRAGRFSRVPPLGSRGLVALRQATVGVTERRRLCVPKDEPVAQSCHGPACDHPADVALERRPRHRDHGRRRRRAVSTQAGAVSAAVLQGAWIGNARARQAALPLVRAGHRTVQ